MSGGLFLKGVYISDRVDTRDLFSLILVRFRIFYYILKTGKTDQKRTLRPGETLL